MSFTDRRPNRAWSLGLAALALTLGYALFLPLRPFNLRIPAVLVLYTVLCLAIAGLAVIVRRWPGTPDNRAFRQEAITILVGAAVMRAILFLAPPTLSDDVFRYLWDGRVQNAGINPYRYPPTAPELTFLRDETFASINHPMMRTVYPPLAQWMFRAAATVRPTVQLQKMASVLFDLGTVFLLLMLLRARGKPPAWAALYAWHPLAVVEFASSGHLDSLMVFLLLAGIVLFERRKVAGGTGLFGLAVAAKWIPIVMAPWLMVRARFRDVALFIATAFILCLPFAVAMLRVAPVLAPDLNRVSAPLRDWVFNASLYNWIAPIVVSPTQRKIFFGAILILFSFWWAKKNSDPARYALGVLFALLLVGPVVHPWYVLWLLPFGALFGSVPVFLWAWAVALTYVVQIRYAAEKIWMLPAWVPKVEYLLLYHALGVSLILSARRLRPPERILPPIPEPRVGVVIPALNEEKAIGLVIAAIPRTFVKEIIVVDNGSTDSTVEEALKAGALVVQEPRRGYGRAVQRGLRALGSGVDVAVVLDGDRADFPEELPQLLRPIQEGKAALVMGSRVKAATPGSLMPQQRFGNWLTCVLIRALYGFRYSDMGPFRAIRRSALNEMKMSDETFGWNVEMQVKALRLGFGVAEVPVRYRPRIGQSKISGTVKGTFRAGTVILWSIYKYAFAGV